MKKADFVKAIEDALGDDGSPLTPHGDAIAAGDGTLHGAIDYWQQQAFTMAAGQCCVKSGGLMADDHGHQFCDMERQRDEWKRKAEEAARLLQEWLNTPFFGSTIEWQKWVSEFRPRVIAAIAAKGEA